VSSRKDFLNFLDNLIKDYEKSPEAWDNNNLQDFLDGFYLFAKSMQNYYDNMHENVDADDISWKMLADMLLGAKVCQ